MGIYTILVSLIVLLNLILGVSIIFLERKMRLLHGRG